MQDKKYWFSAHIIFYYEKFKKPQESYLINENIYLINAKNWKEAEEIAENIGKENQNTNKEAHLEINEEKVMYKYAGIRKIIEVEMQSEKSEFHATPSGVEISYSEFEVDTIDEVISLANGEMVNILYRE